MPEQDFWQNFYNADAPLPWDLGEVLRPLRELFGQHARPPARVLVPGCGRGHDAIYLAGLGFEVTAADFVASAIEQAAAGAAKAGVRLATAQVDVLALPSDWAGRFDLVAEHTCYAAIEPARRDEYVKELFRVLAPGGRVLGVWFDLALFPGRESADEGPPYASTKEGIRERFERLGFLTKLLESTPHLHGDRPMPQVVGIFVKAAQTP